MLRPASGLDFPVTVSRAWPRGRERPDTGVGAVGLAGGLDSAGETVGPAEPSACP